MFIVNLTVHKDHKNLKQTKSILQQYYDKEFPRSLSETFLMNNIKNVCCQF